MTTTAVLNPAEDYIVPHPELIVTEEQAIQFIDQLKAQPMAWVYVVTTILNRPTPKEYIQHREGPSGLTLFYVDGAYAIASRAALTRIGIGSDFEVIQVKRDENGSSALCKLTFKFVFNGLVMSISSGQSGDCPKRSSMSWGDVDKGAITDGLKKCMSEFGWAADVYGMAPEKGPPPPTAEEAAAKSFEYVLQAAVERGLSVPDVEKYVAEHYEGKTLDQLDQASLTSLRRKIQSKDGLK